MEKKKKYLSVGSVLQFANKDGDSKAFISLDNGSLKEFVDYLTQFGTKHLKGLSLEEIREKTKEGKIPRISLNYFDPSEKSPSFVKKNIALKLEE